MTSTVATPRGERAMYAAGVHSRAGASGPQIAAARRERVRSFDPEIARIEREGIAPPCGTGPTKAACAGARQRFEK